MKNNYEKPKITKELKMNFPIAIIEAKTKKKTCRQCSS